MEQLQNQQQENKYEKNKLTKTEFNIVCNFLSIYYFFQNLKKRKYLPKDQKFTILLTSLRLVVHLIEVEKKLKIELQTKVEDQINNKSQTSQEMQEKIKTSLELISQFKLPDNIKEYKKYILKLISNKTFSSEMIMISKIPNILEDLTEETLEDFNSKIRQYFDCS